MPDTDGSSEKTGPEFKAGLDDDLQPDNLDGPGAKDHAAAPDDDARYRDGDGGTYGQGNGQTAADNRKDNRKAKP